MRLSDCFPHLALPDISSILDYLWVNLSAFDHRMFYGSGRATGPNTITEITTTLGHGIRPTKTFALRGTAAQNGKPTTHWVILPVAVTDDTITKTLKPSTLDVTSIPGPQPGQPNEVWFIPGGPKPSDQVTSTKITTIEGLPLPTKETILPGPEPAPGGVVISVKIPAVGEDFVKGDDWSCASNSEPNISP